MRKKFTLYLDKVKVLCYHEHIGWGFKAIKLMTGAYSSRRVGKTPASMC